jgi:hypothetical protein
VPQVQEHGPRYGALARAFFEAPGAKDNLGCLADLQEMTGLGTQELHDAVEDLRRRQGVVSAVALEGRKGTTPRERLAATKEGVSLPGYLAVRPGREKEFRALARGG